MLKSPKLHCSHINTCAQSMYWLPNSVPGSVLHEMQSRVHQNFLKCFVQICPATRLVFCKKQWHQLSRCMCRLSHAVFEARQKTVEPMVKRVVVQQLQDRLLETCLTCLESQVAGKMTQISVQKYQAVL